MKRFLEKVGAHWLCLLLRLTWSIATILIWPVWLITTIPFIFLEVLVLITVIPITWILVGDEYTERLMWFLYYHRNHDLWYWDPGAGDYRFYFSLYPIWGYYLQTKLNNWLETVGTAVEKKYRIGYDE